MPKKKLPVVPEGKKRYRVNFEFTTVRGNLFTARLGEACIDSSLTIEELKTDDEVKEICLQLIWEKKPAWNIFIINITTIEPYEQKKATRNKSRSIQEP